MDREDKYQKLTENRSMMEALVVGTMLKSLNLYREYKLSEKDFIYPKVKFAFTLGRAMSELYSELDEASVLTFVNTSKDFKDEYENYGGWETIEKATSFGNERNIRAYIDDLQKNNFLISAFENNFPVLDTVTYKGKDICPFNDLFPGMTCREVEEFYQGFLNSLSSGSIANSNKIQSLIIKKEQREQLKRKENAGTQYNVMFEYTEKEIGKSSDETPKYIYALPLMSNVTNGVGNGNGLKTLAAHSGLGKTTITFFDLILPMIYRGEYAAIYSNEVNAEYFRAMLTSFVAANIFGYYDLSRTKINNGDFTEEEEILMEKIEQFLVRRGFDNALKFIFTEEFDIDEIIRQSKELASLEGVTNFLIDTFKSEDNTDDAYVGKINENSKKLDSFGNSYKVKVYLTMQLMNATENKVSYLSGNALSECKAVKNVCELLWLMRRVAVDKELNPLDKKFYLKPYRLVQDALSSKWKREYLEDLDLNRQYRLLFLDKSRRGEDNKIVLLEFHGKTGHFKEVGYVEHVSRQQLSY